MPHSDTSWRIPLALSLLVLGIVISLKVIPSIFIVDENNYLVTVVGLQHGRLTVPNTEGLSPSRELLFFDPTATVRAVETTPVASTAPPLYAFLAYPFSWMHWRGLVAINTLSYLATTLMVFAYARRYAIDSSTPWIAAGAFALGSFVIEYALGAWPQLLSVALCTGGIFATGKLINGGPSALAAAAGFLLGVATGVRYQNAAIIAAVGASMLFFERRRWRAIAAFALAAAVPLSTNSLINHVRLDSWNPISKGRYYFNIPVVQGNAGSSLDPALSFWARVVDASVHPPMKGPDFDHWVTHDPSTGANLMLGVVPKKALLQSAPWAVLPLLALGFAWIAKSGLPEGQRQHIRLMSFVVLSVIGAFTIAGTSRHEGLAFNQRYLLELLPLLAITFAWTVDRLGLKMPPLAAGAALGAACALAILAAPPITGGPEVPLWRFRELALFRVPLALAGLLALLWFLVKTGYRVRTLLALAVGASLAWGAAIHLLDDVSWSQRLRSVNLQRTELFDQTLTDSSALVAYWGLKDSAGPLLLDRDIVIIDAHADDGKDAPILIRELLDKQRPVFVFKDGFPPMMLDRILDGLHAVPVSDSVLRVRAAAR